jgi:predicted RNase H-like HicB family nuclease
MAFALLGNSSLQKWGILPCNSEESSLATNNSRKDYKGEATEDERPLASETCERTRRRDAVLFHVTLEEADEDGWIVAECPALPGCVSQGKDEPEALENIKEAIQAWLCAEDRKATAAQPPFRSASSRCCSLTDGTTREYTG